MVREREGESQSTLGVGTEKTKERKTTYLSTSSPKALIKLTPRQILPLSSVPASCSALRRTLAPSAQQRPQTQAPTRAPPPRTLRWRKRARVEDRLAGGREEGLLPLLLLLGGGLGR